ncbi:hypothetical protein CDL12_28747 [Handroanthus impetiginosus]|uniref:Uncharacterized protein n=1 Tax=Handroanthus impetiginosus TaxID=429701 RepID=A0A2G9G0B9_9LAMI|nr:hypothetical protein CDL12_28747 [Handroanthus impetiginosus]
MSFHTWGATLTLTLKPDRALEHVCTSQYQSNAIDTATGFRQSYVSYRFSVSISNPYPVYPTSTEGGFATNGKWPNTLGMHVFSKMGHDLHPDPQAGPWNKHIWNHAIGTCGTILGCHLNMPELTNIRRIL